MPITMKDLTINISGLDAESLLDDWKWAMEEPLTPVLVTAMGDVFAQGESRAVYFLDAVSGTIEHVADDGSEFQALLKDTAFVSARMYPSRIVEYRQAGLQLGPHEVYSNQQPLVLGGEDSVDNVEATDLAVHLSLHGQIHEQVKDLPPGTPVSEIKIE
jgi:hypothetical protein